MGDVPEPPRLKLTAHAMRRMIDRNITEREVRYVLAAPDAVYPSGVTGRSALRSTIAGRRLVVVIADGSEPIEVLTVWET